jgi:hypothetical protein
MYLIPIAWLYVALMMAIAEATSTQGSLLGAVFTLILYGIVPVSIVVYLMGTPLRRKQRQHLETMANPPSGSHAPDAGSHAPGCGLPGPEASGITTMGEKM